MRWALYKTFAVVQSLSCVRLFATPWSAAHQAPLSCSIFQNLLKFMSTESEMPSNHPILCFPLLLPLSFSGSGGFPKNQLFASDCQSIRASASSSVLPMNIQGLFLLGSTGLISLLSNGLSRVFSSSTIWKHQFFRRSPFFMVQLSHLYETTTKLTHSILITFLWDRYYCFQSTNEESKTFEQGHFISKW